MKTPEALTCSRMVPEVVSARQAMLQRCLEGALAAGPPLSTSPPLVAFLSPPAPRSERDQTSLLGNHDSSLGPPECAASSLSTSEDAHRYSPRDCISCFLRSGQRTRPHCDFLSASKHLLRIAVHADRYGSTVRLITALPAQRSDADLLSLQRGMCAGCREALPAAKSSWIHSSTVPSRSISKKLGIAFCLQDQKVRDSLYCRGPEDAHTMAYYIVQIATVMQLR